jgi:hypothetical protein
MRCHFNVTRRPRSGHKLKKSTGSLDSNASSVENWKIGPLAGLKNGYKIGFPDFSGT